MQQYKTKEFLYAEFITKKKSQSQIAKECNVSLATIEYYIKKNGLTSIRPKSRLIYDSDLIDKGNPIFCYYLGLVAADGYFDNSNYRISLRLNKIDSSILHKLCLFFGDSKVRYYRDNAIADFTIVSKKICQLAKDLQVNIDNKTFNLKFPILPSEECYRMFIRGYFDGDGNIRKSGFRATTGSEDFIKGLIEYLNSKFETTIKLTYQKGKHYSYPKIEVNGYKALKILEWLYSTNEQYSIQRKIDKVKAIINR